MRNLFRYWIFIVFGCCVMSLPAMAQMTVPPMVNPNVGGGGPLGPYTPPPCTTPIFSDVPCSNYFSAWINQLSNDQISTGCPYPNFCPDQYVTRAQMSAFLERMMRGTTNWPPHTQLVWAVKAADGSPDATASGQALLTALASIPTSGNDAPSATNPWLLRLGPGIYDVGSTMLSLPQWVNVDGAGINATTIRGALGGTLIDCAGRNEIRSLAVENTGGGTQVSGLWLAGHVDLSGVKITVTGGSSINSGVVSANGNVSTFTDVWAEGDGGQFARGLENQSGTVIVRGGNLVAFAGGTASDAVILFGGTVQIFHAIVDATTTVYNYNNSGIVSVAGSQLEGGSVSGTVTCAGVYDGSFVFHASSCP